MKHCLNYPNLCSVIRKSIPVFLFLATVLCASTHISAQSPPQVTLEGTLTMYMVTRYGDSLQEIDRYRRTTKEGEYVAFILKTDKKLDMAQYLDGDGLASLIEYGETMQSEFLMVQDFESDEPFSEKDFAAQYANKRVRVTGTLFFPMAGWHYVTPVAMEYSRVEVVE